MPAGRPLQRLDGSKRPEPSRSAQGCHAGSKCRAARGWHGVSSRHRHSFGRPIEIGALGQGLGAADVRLPLAVLSNKSCFGHTEGAAGAHLWHNPEGLACDYVPWLECYLPIVHCSFFRALLHLQISQLYTKAAQTD